MANDIIVELDVEALIKEINAKVKMPDDVRNQIVREVAEYLDNKYRAKVPVDTGRAVANFHPSTLRIYTDATFVSVGFDPKAFGKVSNGKKQPKTVWYPRGNQKNWGHFYVSTFDPRNLNGHYGWWKKQQRACDREAKKLIEQKIDEYYNSKK